MAIRGTDREKNLPLDVYFSSIYYSMPTLCSFAHQLRRTRPLDPVHFWEVGYSRACSRAAIIAKLRQHYEKVTTGRFELNPYHLWFPCQ
ncbi:MAG: hypothetical protein E2577_08105 [Starkeya sp.]|nr:hypothetical protein [Starkeya sp.]